MCIRDSIITTRLQNIAETLLEEEQHGFRIGRSCIDCIFTIQQVIEKRREKNLDTHIAFIDFNKAFDRVIRPKLWDILENKGIGYHLSLIHI